jgi:hypothetical protein
MVAHLAEHPQRLHAASATLAKFATAPAACPAGRTMKWAVLGAYDGCDTLIRDDGALFAVLASHAAEQLTVKPALPSGGELTSLGGEKTAEGVELGPFGITILTVTRAAAQAKPRPM